MRVGIIQHKVDFKCTYDEREEIYNIQIPKRAMAESLINRPPLSKIVDVYLEIEEVEPEKAAEPTETEEAIKWIENIKEKYIRGGDEEFDEKRKTALDMAIKALEQNESAEEWYRLFVEKLKQELKWIPVSERLPEKNMPCLVSAGKLLLTQIAIYSDLMGTIDHKIFYQGDYGHENFVDITEYVKAWMPLPEPYKTESEGVNE